MSMPAPEKRFLAIGECMVELSPAEGGLLRMGFAGDTFNTAWYARRLLPPVWEVGYASAVGEDALSSDMLGFFAEQGIATDAVQRLPGRTVGLYMIRLHGGERSFAYWRGQSAARALADDPAWLETALQGRDVLFFSGITLAILPPEGRAALVSALVRCRHAGALVAFDTNLRPGLWANRAEMRAGLALGASAASVVLPSFDEEAWLSGDETAEETLSRYRALGVGTVVVKDGARPCHAWSAEEGAVTVAPPPAAEVVDSTAAGDSFDAAFLAALLQGAGLEAAVAEGAALAAKVIGRRGALARDLFEEEAGA